MYNKFTAVKVSNIDILTLLTTNLRRAEIQTKYLIESKNK